MNLGPARFEKWGQTAFFAEGKVLGQGLAAAKKVVSPHFSSAR
jgi:hypothetical protein